MRQLRSTAHLSLIHSHSKGTDLNTLERIIQVLDGRLVNLKEIPIDMYWFWDEPDWTSETAKSLLPRGTTPELCQYMFES